MPAATRYLKIWGDDECPDMDLKRMLLAYLYGIGWKGGNLFPSKEEIQNPPADGIYTTHISEDDLLKFAGEIFKNVLGREEKLGSHTARKSGYLWAVIRGLTDSGQLMRASGHACIAVALGYLLDALSIAADLALHANPRQRLGSFNCPHSEAGENALRACLPGRQWQVPLPELVRGFMESRVGVVRGDPQNFRPRYIYDKVVAWQAPGVSPMLPHLVDQYCVIQFLN